MRIEEIQFKNFRKYVDTKIKFNKEDNDIHVIIADNGAGKTTFLNAMTWCLYNEEPKIKDKTEALPTLNTDVSDNSKNDIEEASVSLTINVDGDKVIFKRSDIYEIHSRNSEYFKRNNKREELINQEFLVTEIVDNVPNIIDDEEACELYVSSFIPEAIKEFYFFDGEQLDNYFLSSHNIKNQVFTLSHIYLLDSMERRIKTKKDDLRSKLSISSKSDEKLDELNNIDKLIESDKIRLDNLNNSYQIKNDELKSLLNALRDVPSLTGVEEKREENEKLKEKHKKSMVNKNKELMDLIIKKSPKLFAHSAFVKTLELLDEKNSQDDYIYQIDQDVLEDSIGEGVCKVCDRKLDENLIKCLEDKKAKLYLIAPEDKILKSHTRDFKNALKVSTGYLNKEKKLLNEIVIAEETIEKLEDDIKEAYNTVKVHENERKNIDKRDYLIASLPEKKSEIDRIKENISRLERERDKLEKEYDKLCKKEEKNKVILAKKKLCDDSLKVIEKVKKDIMDNTRQNVENSTKSIFFDLIRKTNAFSNVTITPNYEVKLFDDSDRPALSTASASEKELLALAFTLAIHSISGYESPLVVDTLLARTSGVQRKNVAQGCLDVSKNKQILLFLLDDEYTSPVKKLYHENDVSEYKLVESESEKEIVIEKV